MIISVYHIYQPSYKEINLGKVSLNDDEIVKITKLIWKDDGKIEYWVRIYKGKCLKDAVCVSTVEKAHTVLKALFIFETLIKS